MNQKNIKIIGIILLSFTLYAVLFFVLNFNQKNKEGYIIVANLGGYYCKEQICEYKNASNIIIEQEYMKIYQQNKFLDKYRMEYNDKWNFFQNEGWAPIYGDFLGISESLEAEVLELDYEPFSVEDRKILREVLISKGITEYNKLIEESVAVVDLDGNGVKDRIISTSNQNGEMPEEKYFSVLVVILNGKKEEVYLETSNEMNLRMSNVFAVLKLEEKDSTRIITNNGYYDQGGSPSISMYQIKNKEIKEVAQKS